MALPLDFIPAAPTSRALRLITRLIRERKVVEVVIGLPKHLSGAEGASATWVRQIAQEVADLAPQTRVCLVDERRSTVAAQALLHQTGITQRDQRLIIDSTAAQVILGQALETERLTGSAPGEEIPPRHADASPLRKDVHE